MRGLDTLTHTQYDYRNPRCACAPRVKKCVPYFEKSTPPILKSVYPILRKVHPLFYKVDTLFKKVHTLFYKVCTLFQTGYASIYGNVILALITPHTGAGANSSRARFSGRKRYCFKRLRQSCIYPLQGRAGPAWGRCPTPPSYPCSRHSPPPGGRYPASMFWQPPHSPSPVHRGHKPPQIRHSRSHRARNPL